MNKGRIIIGLLLILFGVSALFDQFGLSNLWGFLWPWLVVAFGVYKFTSGSRKWGFFFILFGVLLVLSEVFNISAWSLLWPIFIIFIGVTVFIGDSLSSLFNSSSKVSSEDKLDELIVFNNLQKVINVEEFTGGEVVSIFGMAVIDLTKCKIPKNGASLDLSAIFGGIEIIVPQEMRIINRGDNFLGEWETNYKQNEGKERFLTISGEAVLGKVSIHN